MPDRSDAILEAAIASVVTAVADQGYAVVPQFLPAAAVSALRSECLSRWRAGELGAAGIGRAAQRQQRSEIRGDHILWLDAGTAAPPVAAYLRVLERLRRVMNESLLLGLFELEGHFAVYPPGAFYRRHLDRFSDDDARVLTCILYLNDGWVADDGGQLRIYLDTGEPPSHLDVLPCGGTFVSFLSADFPHEVLPARRERMAITGWLRRRA
jgi:SM-20-related protein